MPTKSKPSRKRINFMQKQRSGSLRQLLQSAAVDWTRVSIVRDCGSFLTIDYKLSPRFFISAAREDLKERDTRSLVNAISNAKRAIDCQSDGFLRALGFDPARLDKQLSKSCRDSLRAFTTNQDHPLKFKLLESLGIVTPAIVSRVRKLRHLLEHKYQAPRLAAVRDAIDVAELYVGAVQGAMNSSLEDVVIESGEAFHPLLGKDSRDVGIRIDRRRCGELQVTISSLSKRRYSSHTLRVGDEAYFPFYRLLFAVRDERYVEVALKLAIEAIGVAVAKVQVRSLEWA